MSPSIFALLIICWIVLAAMIIAFNYAAHEGEPDDDEED